MAYASHLVPVSRYQTGFTTCKSLNLSSIVVFPLNDQTLGVHKVSNRTSHPLVSPPSPTSSKPSHNSRLNTSLPEQVVLGGASTSLKGSQSALPPPDEAWQASYPNGSINPTAQIPGGFGFYLSGPDSFAESLNASRTREALMSYRVMFEEGWEWAKGGKLPGIFGGEGEDAYSCTGGRRREDSECFNARLMWRAYSTSEIYLYLPPTEENDSRLSKVPPYSKQNPDYGYSVGRGSFTLDRAVGRWVSVAIRVRLNSIGEEDGEIQLWIDGESVIYVTGLTIRQGEGGRIKGMHFQTFFGGHTPDWASPRDQKAWFADVTGVIIE